MVTAIDVGPLRDAAQREIDEGLVACQLAVARDGAVVWTDSFGSADDSTRFLVASATKPIVASTAWHFLGDGSLELERPVADYVPEFAANGKAEVTVEQVFLMTCGFPNATMAPLEGADPDRRRARLASWELEYEPGTRYVYHGGSAHWVLAELIERLGGADYRDVVEARVTRPLGLPRVLGIPRAEQHGIAQLALPATDGIPYDRSDMVEAGVPGGGGVMTASTLARFYQGLMHNPGGLWKPDVLADGTGHVRCTLPDPMMGMPANRTIGVVVGNGFGGVWGSSPTAYGWPGMGGQVGFAEPATGISFAFLQAGDTDPQHAFVRAIVLSDLALALGRGEPAP
jgi:CubicO group peptidase (beta-lactamase class C family)